tara:strand:+ start:3168 stop:3554 length:387 start_codon:yes stop_codon:yes gene_type:complete
MTRYQNNFWSISYPLGEIAKNLTSSVSYSNAINLLKEILAQHPEFKVKWELADKRVLDEEMLYEKYLVRRSKVHLMPNELCHYLWIADRSRRWIEVRVNGALYYHALNSLLGELDHKTKEETDGTRIL